MPLSVVFGTGIVLVRMIDGARLQPRQTFSPADLLAWVQKQHVSSVTSNRCSLAEEPRVRRSLPWAAR